MTKYGDTSIQAAKSVKEAFDKLIDHELERTKTTAGFNELSKRLSQSYSKSSVPLLDFMH